MQQQLWKQREGHHLGGAGQVKQQPGLLEGAAHVKQLPGYLWEEKEEEGGHLCEVKPEEGKLGE